MNLTSKKLRKEIHMEQVVFFLLLLAIYLAKGFSLLIQLEDQKILFESN